jgi:hypothetical protein
MDINRHLRTLYFLDSGVKSAAKTDTVDEIPSTQPTNSSGDNSKFQLDDDDINKLKAIGFDID